MSTSPSKLPAPLLELASYLRLALPVARGSRDVLVQIFDSTGSSWAQVSLGADEPVVQPVDPPATAATRWVVSRRHLADVLRRPELYLQDPARLDLGWSTLA